MIVEVYGGNISDSEKMAYIEHVKKKSGNGNIIQRIVIKLDGEFADLEWYYSPVPFDRIRRITGYLSRLPKFNNGKRAEVADRVPHNHHGYDEDYYMHDVSGLIDE
jgi:hypothetical protein